MHSKCAFKGALQLHSSVQSVNQHNLKVGKNYFCFH